MGAAMLAHIGDSLPKQMGAWGDLKAAYRLLNNPRVTPAQIGAAHRAQTLAACAGAPVVLCVQDDTEFHGAKVAGGKNGAKVAGGPSGADCQMLHSTLAVLPEGRLLRVLDQRWFRRIDAPAKETPRQRACRWRETDVWTDAVVGVGFLGPQPAGCRFLQVADRASDNLRFMHTCLAFGQGFVLRAQHDRRVEEGSAKLWDHLSHQAPAGTLEVTIGAQRNQAGKLTRAGRPAVLTVRYAAVRLEPPKNHPDHVEPLDVWGVYLREEHPPEGVAGVDWLLLTSEAAECWEDACRIVAYYQKRWVIEEWHRALKEGCQLEASQVREVLALRRLSALLSLIAVRLLHMRDLARGGTADDPAALQGSVDPLWIQVVAVVAGQPAETLTPAQFWRAVAQKGGFLGRKGDGPPGWKVIWRGWYDLTQMVRYAEALQKQARRKKCG